MSKHKYIRRIIGHGAVAPPHEEYITCPFCGAGCDYYVHPIKVMVNAGGLITSIDSKGTHFSQGSPSGRGVLIELQFLAECGHTFTLSLQFHKGMTMVYLREDETEHETITVEDPIDPDSPYAVGPQPEDVPARVVI
jgi:hypothetical protein